MTTVLVCVPHYLPGLRAGGPIRALTNLVGWLGNEYSFHILTADRDLGDPCPYPGIKYGEWCAVGPAQVRYLTPEESRLPSLWRLVAEHPHDILYLSSFFAACTQRLLLARRFGVLPQRPTIVAPRGEFSHGALRLKPAKKWAYLAFARLTGLHAGIWWQATSSLENDDIQRVWNGTAGEPRVHVLSVPDLPPQPSGMARGRGTRPLKRPGVARVVFLGRISRIKNLLLALRALAQTHGDVAFDVFGPVEDAVYWEECRQQIASLPPHIRVTYGGPVAPERVADTLARYHLFLQLSESENFGHAILEALSAGCALVVGDRTPWRGLTGRGVGWDISPADMDAIVRALRTFVAMDQTRFDLMSNAAIALARAFTDSAENLSAYRNMFAVVTRTTPGVVPASRGA